jgi:transglutaminase-like putative cysteine protease
MTSKMSFEIYLRPTSFIDSDNAEVIAYAHAKTTADKSTRDKVVDLYLAVRDEILYDPYHLILKPEVISASLTLKRGKGYCIEKSSASGSGRPYTWNSFEAWFFHRAEPSVHAEVC